MFFRPFTRFVTAALLLLVSSSAAMAEDKFTALADKVSLMGLLSVAGNFLNEDFIAVSDPTRRVSVAASSGSKEALLLEIAQASGLVHIEVEKVHVFAPAACAVAPPATAPPLSDERISLNFGHVSPFTLLAVLADVSNLKYSNADEEFKLPTQQVSVRLDSVPASQIYRLLSAVTGFRLVAQEGGRFRIEQPKGAICGSPPMSRETIDFILAARGERPSDGCPRRTRDLERGLPSPPSCAFLERFALEDLVVRGRLNRPDQTVALIEVPGGVTYSLKQGDRLGHHHGQVTAVDHRGLTLLELQPDPLNGDRARYSLIDWGNTRHLLKNRKPKCPQSSTSARSCDGGGLR